MHFLLINQFFPPDPAPTGQLLAHVAQALAERGHRVTVICGRASYARAAGAAPGPAVRVHRVRCARFGRGRAARLLSYASFYAGALGHTLSGARADVVLTLTTPPLLGLAGTLARTFRGAAHFIWEMDLYPDIAVALGTFRAGSLADRLVGLLADFSRRRAEGTIVLGSCMRDRLKARGIPPDKILVAENWVDPALVAPQPFPGGPLSVLYSGNLGLAHDIDTVADAIGRLDPARFRFVFAGGGPRREPLQARCPQARFLPYQSQADLASHLGGCHIGLVTQNPETCGTLVPSKVYAYMAAGRPFVFIGPPESTPARIAARHGCGWRIAPGDAHSLVELLQRLQAQPDRVRLAGARARAAFSGSNDRETGVARILHILCGAPQTCISTTSASSSPAVTDSSVLTW